MEAEDIDPFTQKGDEANKIKDLFIREQLLETYLFKIAFLTLIYLST
jgi:hypothetical protein